MTFQITKDPLDTEDYAIDYSQKLATSTPGDILLSSTWSTSTVPNNTDLTIIDNTADDFLLPSGVDFFLLPDGTSHLLLPNRSILDGNTAVVWVEAGGKVGTKHQLVNSVESVAGRKWKRTIEVTMEDK